MLAGWGGGEGKRSCLEHYECLGSPDLGVRVEDTTGGDLGSGAEGEGEGEREGRKERGRGRRRGRGEMK